MEEEEEEEEEEEKSRARARVCVCVNERGERVPHPVGVLQRLRVGESSHPGSGSEGK